MKQVLKVAAVKFNKLEFIAVIYNTLNNLQWLLNNLEEYLVDDDLYLDIEDLSYKLRDKLEVIEKELNNDRI